MIKFETVFLAFQEFQNAQLRALRGSPPQDVLKQRFEEAKAQLKTSLGDLAAHIDWSE